MIRLGIARDYEKPDGASYDQRANAHRPTDPAAIAAEMRRLARSGLTARDIATAFRVNVANVLEAVQEAPA
jgi:hypothetical protein